MTTVLVQIGFVLIFTGSAMLAVQVECDKLTKATLDKDHQS